MSVIEDAVQRVMRVIDREGEVPILSKQEWVEFLGMIQSECAQRANLTRDELARERKAR